MEKKQYSVGQVVLVWIRGELRQVTIRKLSPNGQYLGAGSTNTYWLSVGDIVDSWPLEEKR